MPPDEEELVDIWLLRVVAEDWKKEVLFYPPEVPLRELSLVRPWLLRAIVSLGLLGEIPLFGSI